MCPHDTTCVRILQGPSRNFALCQGLVGGRTLYGSYYYICVYSVVLYVCPHTTTCVLMLLYTCPHTTIYVFAYCRGICEAFRDARGFWKDVLYVCPHTTVYMSSYYYMFFLIVLYMCPHTTVYVFSYSCICVLVLLYICPHTTVYVFSYYCMCPHTTTYVSTYCRVLCEAFRDARALWEGVLYMCPHTTVYVSVLCICVRILQGPLRSFSYRTTCVIILFMCPHTAGAFAKLRDARPDACGKAYYMCSHTSICVLVLLHMCPHTTFHASSYYYICVPILVHVSSYYYMQGPFRNFACCQRLVGRRAVRQVLTLLALLVQKYKY
jgi:hypothetical protein